MSKPKLVIPDLEGLPPEARRKARLAFMPRDTVFSRRFNSADIELWKRAAKKLDVDVVDLVEDAVNAAATQALGRKP